MTITNESVFQIRVVLEGVEPSAWRRLLIPGAIDLAALHDILQRAMGWTDSHLHQFIAGEQRFGIPDPEFDDGTSDEVGVPIARFLIRAGDSLIYEYDFGDGWEHRIALEDVTDSDDRQDLPLCIGGAGACPPEDVGGIGGYEEFLAALDDPGHPDHDELAEWIDSDFDPERFDLEEVNRRLAGR
ncbi:plasmid pRiA4b ORF-3 family protein [Salinisphaera sp. P385]|uniref:Plasmid pRiA4b ORF-3 family protein n=1 Tax=Spectribacter acetivorans TaxID=3075603 RepID=A0ABU3B4Y1_9GAMM|nr:plasmid pRiA4b ORF-3 family protein [Salinisphaera sp. P385]MDT0617513.1 plasmid pRiA4b ORF-3 family protein [Salinisphaera sp. P385]